MCPPELPRDARGWTWVLDLDGVVWLAGKPIPGASDAIDRLRSAGASVLFASNNSWPTVDALIAQLVGAGVQASRDEIVTSSQAAASLLEPGSKALVVGGEGLREALEAHGVVPIVLPGTQASPAARGPAGDDGLERVQDAVRAALDAAPDAVVVGLARQFDYAILAGAAGAVRAGARLIATNDDATYPTPRGLVPGAGAVLAAVATASGTAPEIAGKPYEPIARLITERAGRVAAVVGDRPSTDGELARRLGVAFALVLSGVTASAEPPPDPVPDLLGADLAAVVTAALA